LPVTQIRGDSMDIKNLHFRKKLFLLSFSVSTLILIGSFLGLFYIMYKNEIKSKKESISIVSDKIAQQIDTSFYYIDNLAIQIAANPYIIEEMNSLPLDKSSNYFEENVLENKKLTTFLTSFAIKNLFVRRICLYNDRGDFTYFGVKPVDGISIQDFFDRGRIENNKEYLNDPSQFYRITEIEDDVLLPLSLYPRDDLIISLIRPILTNNDGNYVEIQKSLSSLFSYFEIADKKFSGYLLDPSNNLISENDVIPDFDVSLLKLGEVVYSNGYLISCAKTMNTPFCIVLVEDISIVKKTLINIFLILTLIFLSLLFIVFLIEKHLVYKFTNPLCTLVDDMEKFDVTNNKIIRAYDADYDIINSLNYSFESLQKSVKESLKREVSAKESEYQSRLLALQSQMNPHFIYNILSVISALSDEGDNDKVQSICDKLSALLRYSTSYEDSSVPISAEIKNVNDYLDLMHMRWEDNFESTIDIDDGILNVFIPKFIIQPLVENSFKHGFMKIRPPWKISIKGWMSGGMWYLSLQDNGNGFDLDAIKNFNDYIASIRIHNESNLSEMKIGGLGLKNIAMRLSTVLSDDFIFEIENLEKGSIITIGGKNV
jgi:sensor histidine kinase YesM